ncbi:ATP-grasp domain-containing protein [Lactobacillus melliventris]|uniref:ATP-grasp domain-containing protein n=1 Tax=Lactobacillus melliventris TaxID=1218507 RepID=A0A0F4LGC3_9LACO|nr:ATP-grasp domain-containing protein [Lactobacillus melliventris]KJY57373.1 hypothetical protein JF74_03960 [Lactobacillus melliventris]
MKRALVIGGFRSYHIKLKERGYIIDIIKEKHKIKSDDSNLYNLIIGINEKDYLNRNFIENISSFLDKNNYDLIYNYSEKGQEFTAVLCKILNFPYHSFSTVKAVNNKFVMREKMCGTEYDNIEYKLLHCKNDILSLSKTCDWILKPLNSWGSTDILKYSPRNFKISDLDNLKFPILAEEFINGQEYSVEAFVHKNNIEILSITKKFIDKITFVEIGHTVRESLDIETMHKIEGFLRVVFNRLGIESGITHTEFKLVNDKIFLIETHIRMGGDNISEAISLATGVNVDDLIIDESIDKQLPNFCPQKNIPVSIWFALPKKVGYLKKAEFKCSKTANILDEDILISSGTFLPKLHSSFERVAVVLATGTNREDSLDNARKRVKELVTTIEKK